MTFFTFWKNLFPRRKPNATEELQFAPTSQIDELEEIAVDFFPAILGYDFHGVFVSDQSSVFDFGVDEQMTLKAINDRYGLQLTTLDDGNIVDIMNLIKASRQ
jgi:hypothetical protein